MIKKNTFLFKDTTKKIKRQMTSCKKTAKSISKKGFGSRIKITHNSIITEKAVQYKIEQKFECLCHQSRHVDVK